MSYVVKACRALPVLIFFLLDDSGSMGDNLPGTTDPKFKWTERYLGINFKELMARSTDLEGKDVVIKPRYFVSVIVYGSSPHIWGDEIMDIETALEKYSAADNSLSLGGNDGGTDALAGFKLVHEIAERAIQDDRFKNSFPPMVFHQTDGMSHTDATACVEKIKQLATSDGYILVANTYIGTQTNLAYKGPEDFSGYQTEDEIGSDDDNLRLFRMSSFIPPSIYQNLISDGIFPQLREDCRLFFDVRGKDMFKHAMQVVGSMGSRADRMTR